MTVTTTAAVLAAHARDYLRAMGRSGRGVDVSPRQVRYLMEQLGWTEARPVRQGESRLLDPVDVGLLAVYWLLVFFGVSQRQAWAGVLYATEDIRAALAHPERRRSLQVVRGRVSVVTARDVDPEAMSIDLGDVRRHIDRLLRRHRRRQPWEWEGWRRAPRSERGAVQMAV